MIENFNQRLKNHELLWGTMLTLPDPTVADMISRVGFDWLFVDGEHAPIDSPELLLILHAVADRAAVLYRVPAFDEASIKRALDLGVNGIIVPQVNTPEQARNVVQFSRYAPTGRRGIGSGRAHDYGASFDAYLQEANDRVSIVAQIEHIDAVKNIDRILETPGIDAILVGPYDLSSSLGVTGKVDHPEVVQAISKVTASCREHDMPMGIFGMNANAVQPYVAQGYNLLVAGIDVSLLRDSALSLLGNLQELGPTT